LIGAIIVLLALIPSLILRKPKQVEQAQQSPAGATDQSDGQPASSPASD